NEVVFMADLDAGTQGPPTSAITDESGHYRLRTHNGDQGAVVGKHRVVLLDLEAIRGQMGSITHGLPLPENAKPQEDQRKPAADALRLPSSYSRFNETPLRIEVRPGLQVLDFEVK